jgi:vancomycin resistance protein VanK
LLVQLRGFAKSAGAVFVKLNPDLAAGDSDLDLFREAGYHDVSSDAYLHRATYRIDLSRSEESLLSHLEGRTRRAIARSFRDGVVVQTGNDSDLSATMLARATARTAASDACPSSRRSPRTVHSQDGFLISSHTWMDTIWPVRSISRSPASYVGWSCADPCRRSANASERIQWESILAARRAGEHTYDLHGVPIDAEGEPTGGIHLFKRGFGGRLTRLTGDLDLPLRPSIYRAWTMLQPTYLRRKGGG